MGKKEGYKSKSLKKTGSIYHESFRFLTTCFGLLLRNFRKTVDRDEDSHLFFQKVQRLSCLLITGEYEILFCTFFDVFNRK